MKEHPIIFSTEMVKAILAGKKTITRRIIAERNSSSTAKLSELNFDDVVIDGGFEGCENTKYLKVAKPDDETRHRVFCKYNVADILWVRETCCAHEQSEDYGIK